MKSLNKKKKRNSEQVSLEDKNEKPKQEMKKFQTDSLLTTKNQGNSARNAKLQARLLKARQMAKKREEENKYKASDEIKLKAKQYEGKLPGNSANDQK